MGSLRRLIITGGSAGIGAATVEHFLAAGWRATSISRRPPPVSGADHLACDLADPAAVSAIGADLADQVVEADVCVLVHNACLHFGDAAGACDADDFRAALQVNLEAPNSLNNLVLPLLQDGSAVIYVGSTLSEKAVPGAWSYVISKHASVGMMRATCQDMAGRGVHSVCVCPGFTETEMMHEHLGASPERVAAAAARSTHGRLIAPAEIAETIFWAATHPVLNGGVLHAHLGQIES